MSKFADQDGCFMKRITKIIVAVVAVSALLAATCPGKQRHINAEVKLMSTEIHKQAERLTKDFDEKIGLDDEQREVMTHLEKSLISQIEDAVKQCFVLKNYVLFSIGKYENETDGAMTASVGILGMVFLNKKELKADYNFHSNGSK